jgi:hypothetical protein
MGVALLVDAFNYSVVYKYSSELSAFKAALGLIDF